MMTSKLFINGIDAWTEWRAFLEDGSLDKLMLPASFKPFVENKSRSMNGKQVLIKNTRLDERDLTLVFCFAAHELNSFPPFTGNNDPVSMQVAFTNQFSSYLDTYAIIDVIRTRVSAFMQTWLQSLPYTSRVIAEKIQSNIDGFLAPLSGNMLQQAFGAALRNYLGTITRTIIIPDANARMMRFVDTVRAGNVNAGKIYPVNLGSGDLNLTFKVVYISALELSSANDTIAKLALRFNEPDPSDRSFINS